MAEWSLVTFFALAGGSDVTAPGLALTTTPSQRLRWSRGLHAGLWYPRSRVRSRPKPSDFSYWKNPQHALRYDTNDNWKSNTRTMKHKIRQIKKKNPPGRSRRIFSGVKILSMPSFGREVKQFVPCRRFAARKRTLFYYVEVGHFSLEVPSFSNRVLRNRAARGSTEGSTLEQHGRPWSWRWQPKGAVYKGPV
jgi:hypothetical protein